jgi:hypothetical protein
LNPSKSFRPDSNSRSVNGRKVPLFVPLFIPLYIPPENQGMAQVVAQKATQLENININIKTPLLVKII